MANVITKPIAPAAQSSHSLLAIEKGVIRPLPPGSCAYPFYQPY